MGKRHLFKSIVTMGSTPQGLHPILHPHQVLSPVKKRLGYQTLRFSKVFQEPWALLKFLE